MDIEMLDNFGFLSKYLPICPSHFSILQYKWKLFHYSLYNLGVFSSPLQGTVRNSPEKANVSYDLYTLNSKIR